MLVTLVHGKSLAKSLIFAILAYIAILREGKIPTAPATVEVLNAYKPLLREGRQVQILTESGYLRKFQAKHGGCI